MTADPAERAMLAAVLAPPRHRAELVKVRRMIADCGPHWAGTLAHLAPAPYRQLVARERELAVEDDLPRLLYADWLDERSESTPCPACRNGQAPTYGPVRQSQCGSCGGRLTERSDIGNRRGGHNPKWCPLCLTTHLPQHAGYSECPRCRGAGRVCGGAERAAFIRTQIELARIIAAPAFRKMSDTLRPQLGRVTDDVIALGVESREDVAALRRRERELLDAHEEAWRGPILSRRREHGYGVPIGNYRSGAPGAVFRRGFVEEVELPAADFFQHADALTAATPLRRVRFTDWPSGVLARPCGACPDCTSRLPAGRCEAVRDALATRWPLIEFKLPAAGTFAAGGSVFQDSVTANIDLDRMPGPDPVHRGPRPGRLGL